MKKTFLGFHYDIARGTYLKSEYFCRAIQLAAQSGYTHFLPYLENMIRLPSMEKACPSCAYTAEDWAKFESVARDASIELVPHFNVIGHTELICPAYPEIGGVVDRGHVDLDVERAVTREWTLRCLDEFCRISHGQHFWIGGDEWQPPQHLLAQPTFDVARAWVGQVNMAVEFLARRGRLAIVAHDMLLNYPAALELLSRKSIILYWFYDYDSDYAALDTFKRMGFKTIMTAGLFGGDSPRLTRRCADGVRCAAAAAEKYDANGIVVTTWEGARWELQTFNIPMTAKLLQGNEPPGAILDTLTLLDASTKLPADSQVAMDWKSKARRLLQDFSWNDYPELQRSSLAVANDDVEADLALYKEFHYPQGHQFDRIAKGNVRPTWTSTTPTTTIPASSGSFGLKIDDHPKAGTVLRFSNGNECFDVYPQFGGTLQNWCCGGRILIPESMERFLQRERFPGGYRSYSNAGGFRPIWGMGAHHNPCIIWQYPYAWTVIEQSSARVMVELKRDFHHVAIAFRIIVERGQSGFQYDARAVNKLEHSYGAFNFNLPLTFSLEDVAKMKFSWQANGARRETTVASQARSAFWIPAQESLKIANPSASLTIHAAPEQTAGYFVDWGPGFVTPDLHGIYRKLAVGDEVATRWKFSLDHQ